MRGGLHAWLTSVPQDLKSISFVEGKEGEREIPSPPHTHLTHKLKIQTTSNISSDPTFQMDLSPASVKLLPKIACLHLNSLHASCICNPLQSGLLPPEACSLSHQKPPDLKSTDNFPQTHPLIWVEQTHPSLAPQPTSSFLTCYSLCVSSPPFSLCFLSEYRTFLSWPLKLLHSPWVAIFTDSTTTCSVKTTQAPCSSQVSPSNTRLLLPMTCRSSPPSTSR